VPVFRKLIAYLASLSVGRIFLWCYLIWYLVVLVRYFDPSPYLWLTSLGMGMIVGSALVVNTTLAGRLRNRLEYWQAFRFFLTPFCVASFSALVKGHHFILIFSPKIGELLTAALLCGAFCTLAAIARRVRAAHSAQAEFKPATQPTPTPQSPPSPAEAQPS